MKFIIEQSAYSGVLKIAGKVAHDMELVTGTLPEIRVVETIDPEEVRSSAPVNRRSLSQRWDIVGGWMHRKVSRRMC